MASPSTTPELGVASEVGVLRSVIVHRPDLAHERLSPTNCHELLFDDVIWTRRARQEHDAFVDLMRSRGAEVLLFHDLLTETLADASARAWLLERKLRPEEVTTIFAGELTAWMTEMGAEELATHLTGGVTLAELPADIVTTVGRALRPTDFVLPPLPNTLFMRDTSAWIYGGVSINAMFWPARQHETLNLEAVYRFHPRFREAGFEIWYGGFDHNWGSASLEGGDIMPVGDGVVLVGQGERSTAKAVQHPRLQPVRGRCRAPGDRRADAALARGHAPRHGLHVLRPPRRDDVRARRVGDHADPVPARRRRRRERGGLRALVRRRAQGRARASPT